MTKKILIAEDDLDCRQVLQDMLKVFERYDVAVLVAENGVEALEMAQRERPDLILLDVMMPGMDGYAVCRQIKANPDLAGAHIIIVTSKTSTQDRLDSVMADADEFLTKPYRYQMILERVQQVLAVVPI